VVDDARVRFEVLGPVRATVAGEPIALGGPKRTALLAALLLDAGRVVSTDRLIAAVWEGDPPASARSVVHGIVRDLRRAVAAAGVGTEVIATRRPGYLLRPDACTTDVDDFERLLARAREPGDTARRARLLRDALALWAGPALDGLDAPIAAAAATALEEQRLAALEERIDGDLELGRHATVVAELTRLVEDFPLRERFRGQLMLALYRSGRQAEALEEFRRCRRSLVAELGIEPGHRLRELERAILAEDPRLGRAEPLTALPRPRAAVRARVTGPRLKGAVPALALVAGALLAVPASTTDPVPAEDVVAAAPQQVVGPAWQQEPPTRLDDALFGVTMNSDSGAMPDFRVGAVRLWDSATRWANVEPEPGRYRWNRLDRLVAGAEAAGHPVLYTMGLGAAWTNPAGAHSPYTDSSTTAAPADRSAWDRYVGQVARRYAGRVEAYELWNLANSPRYYTGTVDELVELTRRAAAIIRAADPAATVVCPSMGELWQASSREYLHRFALAGGYRHCDVAAVKLHQRHAEDTPESMAELAEEIDRVFHRAGVHKPLWNTGSTYDIALEPPLSQADADNYGVRFYLVGIHARYDRMYFYNWGSRGIPLVLQPEGGEPTRAARNIGTLAGWLSGARVRSCSHGRDAGLPPRVWECRFVRADAARARVLWTDDGEAELPTWPTAARVHDLSGARTSLDGRPTVRVGESPVMVVDRPGHTD
jgi:DNA-binding SARP family transcriptional activator